MFYLRMPSFSSIGLGLRATSEVPNLDLSLGRIVLELGGSLTKAAISEISVKIGSRTIFGPVSGTVLDSINKYRGIYDQSGYLTIDFCEPTGLSQSSKEEGAIDIKDLRGEGIFVEVVNTLASGSFTLSALCGMTTPQVKMVKDAEGKLVRATGQVLENQRQMKKLLQYQVPSSGGTRCSWTPNFRGSDIIRIHFYYPTGTNWTSSANGTLQELEIKSNGVSIHDRVTCMQSRFLQNENKRVPQGFFYVWDPTMDNVFSNAFETKGKQLQFDLTLGSVVPISAYVECYDVPGNL